MRTTLFATMVVVFLACMPTAARADGAEMFDKKCAGCHGKDGKAQTTMGKKLNMRDLTNPEVQKGSSDEQWQKIIIDGVKGAGGKNVMPATKVTADEVKDLVKHVRALKK